MGAGIELAEWFANEAERVYDMFSETLEGRDQRKLLDWIRRRGGDVTARELQQGPRKYRERGAAKAALDALAVAGVGEWYRREPGPSGGQPASRFRLLGDERCPGPGVPVLQGSGYGYSTVPTGSETPRNVPLGTDIGGFRRRRTPRPRYR